MAQHRSCGPGGLRDRRLSLSNSDKAPLLAQSAAEGRPAKGKETFESVGCLACHVTEKDSTARRSEASEERDYAPNLWNIADKARRSGSILDQEPESAVAGTKMPDLRLSDARRRTSPAF